MHKLKVENWFILIGLPMLWAWSFVLLTEPLSKPFPKIKTQNLLPSELAKPKLWQSWPSSDPLSLDRLTQHFAQEQAQHSSLLVVGDTRASASGLGPSSRWPSLAHSFKHHNAKVLLHLGDWVQEGQSIHQWQQSLQSLSLLDPLALLTVKGNHDRGGLFETLGLSDVPSAPLRISKVGDMLIFLFDSEVRTEQAQASVENLFERGQVKAQVKTLLQASSARLWVQHRPIWSSGNHGSDERGWRHWLVPKLEQLKIDLVLAGHDHDYERFCPSKGVDHLRRCDPHGITYVVSGGGATVTVPFPNLSWKQSTSSKQENDRQRQVFSSRAHYLYIYLAEQKLHLEAWGSEYMGQRVCFDQAQIPLKMSKFSR